MIQSALPSMGPMALADLLASWRRAGLNGDPADLDAVVEDWYRKALFVAAQRSGPVNPQIDQAEWVDFPDEVSSDR